MNIAEVTELSDYELRIKVAELDGVVFEELKVPRWASEVYGYEKEKL